MGAGVLLLRPRPKPAHAPPREAPAAAARPGGAHRDRHADLQRARADGVRRPGRDDRFARRDRRIGALRRLRPQRHVNDPDIRAAEHAAWSELAGAHRRRRRGRRDSAARPLPLAPAPDQAQGRQRRRLLPPLGRGLPLLHRPRCRQRHDRRMPDDAGAHDGSASRRRHHPDRAARGRPRDLARPRSAVRRTRLRAAVHRRHALLAARRIALLGPQRDPAHGAVPRPLRAAAAAGRGPARRAK